MGLMCPLAAHLLQCRSSLCLHLGSELLLLCFFHSIIMAATVFFLLGCKRVVFVPFSLCVWSQRPWRSRQIILLPLVFFFARTPSRIRRIVKICDVVDRFFRKPFWFFLSIFSILVSHLPTSMGQVVSLMSF